jgi:hypothetical protein
VVQRYPELAETAGCLRELERLLQKAAGDAQPKNLMSLDDDLLAQRADVWRKMAPDHAICDLYPQDPALRDALWQSAQDNAANDSASLRLTGEVWHIRYLGEKGDYPARGNQCIAWLAKLLAVPNRVLTVGDLRGDQEDKLLADARLRDEPETDREGIAAIKRRLQEIADITTETGGSESLMEEEADLLDRVKRVPAWACGPACARLKP